MNMLRTTWAFLAVLVLFMAGNVGTAQEGLAGTYKVTLFLEGQNRTLWLLQLEQKEGKWDGKIIAGAGDRNGQAKVMGISVADGLLRCTFTLQNAHLSFEGKLPEEKGKTIYGTVLLSGRLVLTELEPTLLMSLDPYEMSKEEVARATTGSQVFRAVQTLLSQAEARKARPEEVRSWAEKAFKTADAYGPRQQRETALNCAEALVGQEGFADIAVTFARRAERSLEPRDRMSVQRRTLQVLATALKKAGKEEEAKVIENRLAKMPVVKTTAYAGRKGTSTRTVLVELFTGAQCPPCVAADLAFDALGQTYKPSEVVLLQYHEHIPRTDPLANPDSEDRLKYYSRMVEGTPTVLFNGRPDAEGGGGIDEAQAKYNEFREVIDEQLEKPGMAVKLTARAVRKGNTVQITATVSDLADPADKLRLRLALVEANVEYAGSNKITLHHHVVRVMPGGPEGMALKDKTATQTVTVDLDKVRKDLEKYQDELAKGDDPFPGKKPAVELKNLTLVAFVQNDQTREVLLAVQTEVKAEE
jgi:hypothetical protein